MSRVGLIGCSSALPSNSSSEQLQTLKFESDPRGVDSRTTQSQTCKTPCELTVPSREQPVTITTNDYVPQAVQVTLGRQPDLSFWENPPPRAGALEDVSKVLFEIVSMYS